MTRPDVKIYGDSWRTKYLYTILPHGDELKKVLPEIPLGSVIVSELGHMTFRLYLNERGERVLHCLDDQQFYDPLHPESAIKNGEKCRGGYVNTPLNGMKVYGQLFVAGVYGGVGVAPDGCYDWE